MRTTHDRILISEAAALAKCTVSYVHKLIKSDPKALDARRISRNSRIWTVDRALAVKLGREVAKNAKIRSRATS